MKEKNKKTTLFIVVCILTILILVIALKINDSRIKEELSQSQMDNYLTEINYEEISNYVIEQPSIIIYVSNSAQSNISNFENIFKPVIKKYNLENEIIYININDTTIIDPIYQNAPELVVYKDGEISDVIDCDALKTSSDIIKSLKERGIIND